SVAVDLEGGDRPLAQDDRSARTVRLRLDEHQACFVLALQSPSHGELAAVEVYVFPAKAEKFALPHPGRYGVDIECMCGMVACRRNESHDLVLREDPNLRPLGLRWRYPVARISSDQPPADGLSQRSVEDSMGVVDAAARQARGRQVRVER